MALTHGTRSSYNGGCRCDLCKQASRDYVAKKKAQKASDQQKPAEIGKEIDRFPKTELSPTPEPTPREPGRVEKGILTEVEPFREHRPGLVEVAVTLARVLDNGFAVPQHSAAAHRLSEILDKLRGGSAAKGSGLSTVRSMTRTKKVA